MTTAVDIVNGFGGGEKVCHFGEGIHGNYGKRLLKKRGEAHNTHYRERCRWDPD